MAPISYNFKVMFLWYSSIFYIYSDEHMAKERCHKAVTQDTPNIIGKFAVSYNDWAMNIGTFRKGNNYSANMHFYNSVGFFKMHSGLGGFISEFAIIIKFFILFLNVSSPVCMLIVFKNIPLSAYAHTFAFFIRYFM